MQTEFKINRSTRRCHLLDRPLTPGEWYYSVVSEADDESFSRVDISAQAWQGPPEGSVGWWKCRMPEAGERKLKPAPDALLIDLLLQSADDAIETAEGEIASDTLSTPETEQVEHTRLPPELRYLLALTLMRRRILVPVSTDETPGVMTLEVANDGTRVTVAQQVINGARLQALGEQLNELLYCEAD